MVKFNTDLDGAVCWHSRNELYSYSYGHCDNTLLCLSAVHNSHCRELLMQEVLQGFYLSFKFMFGSIHLKLLRPSCSTILIFLFNLFVYLIIILFSLRRFWIYFNWKRFSEKSYTVIMKRNSAFIIEKDFNLDYSIFRHIW